MKLAISSLAWEPADDTAVRALLARRGVRGIELAPLKYWPSPPGVAPQTLSAYSAEWADAGIAIIALQGILFGFPELRLFGSAAQQDALERHLVDMTAIASALGASVLVLGAPRNRLRGELSEEEAIEQAAPLLRRVGVAAQDRGCVLCVEPTPHRYDGDFVRSIQEAERLVDVVAHPGVALHLDAGAISIVDEPDDVVRHGAHRARHFHASEIDLLPLGAGTVDHRRLAGLLRASEYAHWCSVEMRPIAPHALLRTINDALDVALLAYGA